MPIFESKSIRINAIWPGAIDPPMRWANPTADVAMTIAYPASKEAAFFQDADVQVDENRLAWL